jgi:hypothetical protein
MKSWKRIEPTEVNKVGFRVITSKTFEYTGDTRGTYGVYGRMTDPGAVLLAYDELTKVNRGK